MKNTKILSVMYEKGGVGKTTTAVNTAAILAAKGFKILLVDLDPQSYATGYFSLYDDDRPSTLELLKCEDPKNIICRTPTKNLDLLPSAHRLADAENYLTSLPCGSEFVLLDSLEKIKSDYDFIIFDCPPAGMRIKTNAMTAADYLILPTIPDDYAIQGLICITKQIAACKRSNPSLKVAGVLLTLDEATSNKKAYKAALQNQKIFPCFRQTIRKNTTLSEAINAHKPISEYKPGCNGAKDYAAFVDELLEVIK